MRIFTVGFAGKSARVFFGTLQKAGVKRVIDVRLYNTSQLAGYAKKADMEYFLESLVQAQYIYMPIMAPTRDILEGFKKGRIDWAEYEARFNELIAERHIENAITPEQGDNACFLCSEGKPDYCHRRLVAQYLARHWKEVEIDHL